MALLPIFKSDDKDLMLLQNRWSSILNPLISSPISSSNFLKNIKLSSGNNAVNHLLQREIQGYIVTGMRGAFAQVYQVPSQSPQLNLILNSSGSTTIDLLVF